MSRRNRRTVITSVGVVLTGLAAGCLDETSAPEDEASTDDSATDEPEIITEEPRVDEPPHEIDPPERSDDPDEESAWNPNYLGEQMETEPTLSFDSLENVRLAESALDDGHGGDITSPEGIEPETADSDEGEINSSGELEDGADSADDEEEATEETGPEGEYAVHLIDNTDDLSDAVDLEASSEDTSETLEEIDFEDTVVVIVESGWGSSSVIHQWARVEADEDAISLHGYYTDPEIGTTDYTTRHSVLTVERPDDLEFARMSLTTSPDRRVHVNSTEGVVSVDES